MTSRPLGAARCGPEGRRPTGRRHGSYASSPSPRRAGCRGTCRHAHRRWQPVALPISPPAKTIKDIAPPRSWPACSLNDVVLATVSGPLSPSSTAREDTRRRAGAEGDRCGAVRDETQRMALGNQCLDGGGRLPSARRSARAAAARARAHGRLKASVQQWRRGADADDELPAADARVGRAARRCAGRRGEPHGHQRARPTVPAVLLHGLPCSRRSPTSASSTTLRSRSRWCPTTALSLRHHRRSRGAA